MDKAVNAIDPMHQSWILQEEPLYSRFPEHAKCLFEMDELQGMLTSCMHCALNERYGRQCPTELVYPVDQSPIPDLHKEGESF